MPRLGELLVAAGRLTPEQVEQALRAQVMWGARLGTNLIELGFVDLDTLSDALATQHKLPAALARHFERAEAELQQRLPAALAAELSCVPLFRAGDDIVVASSSPLSPPTRARLAEVLGAPPGKLVAAVAAELRIRYQLERLYGIERPARWKRAPGKTIPPFPELVIEAADDDSEPELLLVPADPARGRPARAQTHADAPEPDAEPEVIVGLDEAMRAAEPAAPVAQADDTPSGRERRTYVRTIADAPLAAAPAAPSLGRIALRKVAVRAASEGAPAGEARTLEEATRAIRRAKHRDRVAELTLEALEEFAPGCEAATILVLRGQVATSWLGFCARDGMSPEIAVPLDQPGLVARVAREGAAARVAARELQPLDQLLFASLGAAGGDLAALPITIGGQVMCVLALVIQPAAALAPAEAIAAAAGAAFARLIRDAAR